MHNVFIILVAVASTPYAPSSSFLSSRTQCNGCEIPLQVMGWGSGCLLLRWTPWLLKDTALGCMSLSPEHLPTPLGSESLEDCGDHQVLEGRGPDSGHVHELSLTKRLWVWERGGHFSLTLGSFLIAHPSPQVTLLPRLFSHQER